MPPDAPARPSDAGAWATAQALARATPPGRNRYVDFLRAFSIFVVVVGHWLMAAPAIDRGELTLSDMLSIAPWTQWLTWAFQVMPLFFIVGGYSNAVSWESARRAGRPYGQWLGARLRRLVAPLIPLVMLWGGIGAIAHQLGVSPELIQLGSQVALIPTWFLAVYVMVVVAAPGTHWLWRRYGIASFWGLFLGAVAVDFAGFFGGLPWLRWVNYAFVWLGVHHLGYVWHAGWMAGPRRALTWSAGGLALLFGLVFAAGYPLAMLTVPGEEVSNSRPPTLALLALGIFHGGLVLALEAPARRWLEGLRPWAATVLVNGTIMTLYLWHVTAMVMLVAIAQLLGGVGLGLEPGGATWWLSRPAWIGACAVLLLGFMAMFGRLEAGARTGTDAGLPAWQAVAGAVGICAGIPTLAIGGVWTASEIGIRVWPILLVLLGASLVVAPPAQRRGPAAGA